MFKFLKNKYSAIFLSFPSLIIGYTIYNRYQNKKLTNKNNAQIDYIFSNNYLHDHTFNNKNTYNNKNYNKNVTLMNNKNLTIQDLENAHNAGIKLNRVNALKLLQQRPDIADIERYANYEELFYLMPKKFRDQHKDHLVHEITHFKIYNERPLFFTFYGLPGGHLSIPIDPYIEYKLYDTPNIFALENYVISGQDLLEIIVRANSNCSSFVKVIPKTLNNTTYNYTYKKGHNIDTKPFDPLCNNCAGGLYFTNYQKIKSFSSNNTIIANVDIINSPNVFYKIEHNQIKGTSISLDF